MSAITEKKIEEPRRDDDDINDEEKAFLATEQSEHQAYPEKTSPPGLSNRFWFFAALNTLSTVGIVSTPAMRTFITDGSSNHSIGLCKQATIRT